MDYRRYLSNIENTAKKLSDLQKRLDYLKLEQKHFLRMGDTDAEHVKEMFQVWVHELEMEIKSKKRGDKEQIPLETMFENKNHLSKLVEKLIEKGFCHYDENGHLRWTGKEIFAKGKKKGSGYQMVALSELCRELYLKDRQFEVQEVCLAWNTYFNTTFARELFSTPPPEKYFGLFKNLVNSLRYI